MTTEHRKLLDRVVEELVHGAEYWTATDLDQWIALLERLMPRVLAQAEPMTVAAAHAKGYSVDSGWAAE